MEDPQDAQDLRISYKTWVAIHLGFSDGQELIRTMQEAHPLASFHLSSLTFRKVADAERLAPSNPLGRSFFYPDFPRNVDAVLQGDDSGLGFFLFNQLGKVV